MTGMERLLNHEADAFDSAKSYISTYHTPGTPSRFQRESPSKLLRTLSRATSTPIDKPQSSGESVYHSQYDILPVSKGLLGSEGHGEGLVDEETSLDEADKTLNSIIESTEDASIRIRRILEQSKQDRSLRQQSLSPERNEEERQKHEHDEEQKEEKQEKDSDLSVWGEKSFFRRMAKKAPGGWAFTPQPKFKLGRTIQDDQEEQHEDELRKRQEEKQKEGDFEKVNFSMIMLMIGF